MTKPKNFFTGAWFFLLVVVLAAVLVNMPHPLHDSSQAKVRITWEQPEVHSNFTSFRVYRSDDAEGEFNYIGSTDEPYFTDDKVERGHIYRYEVRTVNPFMMSDPSQVIRVMIP